MLRVVTTNNIDVFRHFGAKAFQAMSLEHTIAADYDAALELVHTKRPHIAILDTDLAGGDGFALCRAIKDDPALAQVRVMLVLGSVVSRRQLEQVEVSGCDDVLALPMHQDDFHAHIAQVARLPHRLHERKSVDIDAEFPAGTGAEIETVENLSLGGIGVVARGELEADQSVFVRLRQGTTSYPLVGGRIAWCAALDDERAAVGIAFVDVPIEARLLVDELCLFNAAPQLDGSVTVGLHGDFHERTDFAPLLKRLRGESSIDFDMREVRYLSACGVRNWCEFLAELPAHEYSFRHASMAFVSQCAMSPACAGRGTLVSFEAPYHCEGCDRDDVRLLDAGAIVREGDELITPTLHCGGCRGELVFDDVPSRYLSFLVTDR